MIACAGSGRACRHGFAGAEGPVEDDIRICRAQWQRGTLGKREELIVLSDLPILEEDVGIPATGGALPGHLVVPHAATGFVVFAHGSGSSRHSPRNRFVAEVLNRAGLGTLLVDLLTPSEELGRVRVFDIDLLSRRLLDVTAQLGRRDELAELPFGYFGASTGAAAALRAAAEPGSSIAAVVSRGGRPDLAGTALAAVRSPTLLIVGGDDHSVVELNRWAARQLTCENELRIVPGATHLFAEPGTLDRVAELARDWLTAHLAPMSGTGHDLPGTR